MAEIDPLVLQIIADNKQMITALRQADRAVDQSTRGQGRAVKNLEKQFLQSSTAISSSLKSLAGGIAAYFGVREVAALKDSYTRFTNSLKTAGLEGGNLANTQERLFGVAQKYQTSLEGLGGLFGSITRSSKELGVSQDQIFKVVESVSAGMKVQGISATEASGALTQLGQAFGSSRVQAEEFQSIKETLPSVLQAGVDSSDRFKGSLNALTNALKDTKGAGVSGRELFDLIASGYEKITAQAAAAAPTIAGAFQTLTNALTQYVGTSQEAGSAADVLAGALKLLADNLDTLIPALALVAAGLGVGMVTNAVAARVALASTTAAAAGATGALGTMGVAARGAGASLLTAFGGPAGLAILAVTAALGSLVLESSRAEEAQLANARASQELGIALTEAQKEALKAADGNAGVGAAASAAEPQIYSFKNSVDGLTRSLYEQAKAARVARVELLGKQLTETRARQDAAYNRTPQGSRNLSRQSNELLAQGDLLGSAGAGFSSIKADVLNVLSGGRTGRNAKTEFEDTSRIAGNLQSQIDRLHASPIGAGDLPTGGGGSRSAPAAAGKPKRGPKGKSAEQLAREAEAEAKRQAAEAKAEREKQQSINERIAQGRIELLQAEAGATQNALIRFSNEVAALDAQKEFNAQRIANDEELNKTQRDELLLLNEAVAAQRREQIGQQHEEQLARERLDLLRAELDAQDRLLADQLDVTRDREERRRIELERTRIAFLAKEAALADALDAASIAGDTNKVASIQRDIAQLAEEERAARARVVADYQSPGQRYLEDIRKTSGEINDDAERIAIGGLESLNDGLVDAITGAKSLGDVFKDVANGIIKDLLRIAIQQAVIRPLAEGLFNPGGGGGAGGGFGGGFLGGALGLVGKRITGRQGGGAVNAGQLYRVNEGTAPGGAKEFFRPSVGGNIVPLGQTNAVATKASAGASGMATVRVELSGDLDARIVDVSGPVAVKVVQGAAGPISDMGAQKALKQAGRPTL